MVSILLEGLEGAPPIKTNLLCVILHTSNGHSTINDLLKKMPPFLPI